MKMDGGLSTKYKAPSTKYKAPSTKYKAQKRATNRGVTDPHLLRLPAQTIRSESDRARGLRGRGQNCADE
jgi:hypothetical protein